MVDISLPFILTMDWSKMAVGALLSQLQPEDPSIPASLELEYVLAYASRALTPACIHPLKGNA
jgi:hypothetical protein